MELNKIFAIIGGVVLLIVGISVTVFFSTTGSTTGGDNREIDSDTIQFNKMIKISLQLYSCVSVCGHFEILPHLKFT